MSATAAKPAFYAVGRGTGGIGDWFTVLHPPYTLWHLAYVVIGAAVMRPLVPGRLGLTVLAFFLAVGIGAHALDELHGRPLATGIPGWLLITAAVVSVAAAMGLGWFIGGLKLLPFVLAGGLLVVGYNLELFGGLLHSNFWFGAAWGAFPALVGSYTQHWTVSFAAGAVALAAFFLSLAQRALSTPARALRRRVTQVSAQLTFNDGCVRTLGRAEMLAPIERTLRYLVWAVTVLALALVLPR